MIRRLVFGSGVALILSVMSCTPTEPSKVEEKHVHIYDVPWTVLVRDYNTAHSYTNQRVRIRIDANDYRVENGEIRIYAADNGTPPILILRGVDFVPSRPLPALIVTGTCRGPIRDKVWRTRTADFYCTLDGCVLTVR